MSALSGRSTTTDLLPWRIAYWLLLADFVLTAILNLRHVHAGFLTSYAADLCVPAWMYIVMRRFPAQGALLGPVHRWLGHSPERAAGSLFLASALTELSQIPWPQGLFRGVFDPLDLVAYAGGLAACYALDRWQSNTDLAR